MTTLVREELVVWMAKGCPSAEAINNGGFIRGGCCADFAIDVSSRARSSGFQEPDILGVENFMIPILDENGEWDDVAFGAPFDREFMAIHWPSVQPPEGMNWNDLDQVSEECGFGIGTHEWVSVGGRHYDSEASEGVDNFFDLPLLAARIADWKQRHETERSVASPRGP